SLFNRGSTFEVQAAGATAVAREGVTGFTIDEEGNLWCWAIAGEPLEILAAGAQVVLGTGQEVGLGPAGNPRRQSGRGELGVVRPRGFGAGLLEVTSEGAAQVRV